MEKSSSIVKKKNCKIGKMPKFVPKKIPRYLPGSVHKQVLKTDLKEYNKHLYKVFTAEPKVDTKPPKFQPHKYFKIINMTADVYTLKGTIKRNKEMINKINKINITKGKVDTFNPYTYKNLSKWNKKEVVFNRIKKQNEAFYKRLLKTESLYSKSMYDKEWTAIMKKIQAFAKYPLVAFQKKTKDEELKELPSISRLADLALINPTQRTKCFIEFQIKNGLKLGKIIIELYNDITPITATIFSDILTGYQMSSIQKIYKKHYCIFGDVLKTNSGKKETRKNTFTPENFILNHTKTGVISMFPQIEAHKYSFCITFKAIPEFDEKNIVFGKVVKGAVNLLKVNDLGSKYGKPITEIIISNCGQL